MLGFINIVQLNARQDNKLTRYKVMQENKFQVMTNNCTEDYYLKGRSHMQFCVPEPGNKRWIPEKPKCLKKRYVILKLYFIMKECYEW